MCQFVSRAHTRTCDSAASPWLDHNWVGNRCNGCEIVVLSNAISNQCCCTCFTHTVIGAMCGLSYRMRPNQWRRPFSRQTYRTHNTSTMIKCNLDLRLIVGYLLIDLRPMAMASLGMVHQSNSWRASVQSIWDKSKRNKYTENADGSNGMARTVGHEPHTAHSTLIHAKPRRDAFCIF